MLTWWNACINKLTKKYGVKSQRRGTVRYGSDLMYAGLPVSSDLKEYDACQIYISKID